MFTVEDSADLYILYLYRYYRGYLFVLRSTEISKVSSLYIYTILVNNTTAGTYPMRSKVKHYTRFCQRQSFEQKKIQLFRKNIDLFVTNS